MKTFILLFAGLVTVISSIPSWGVRPPSETERYSVIVCGYPSSSSDNLDCSIGQHLTSPQDNVQNCKVNRTKDGKFLSFNCQGHAALPEKRYHCGTYDNYGSGAFEKYGPGTFALNDGTAGAFVCD